MRSLSHLRSKFFQRAALCALVLFSTVGIAKAAAPNEQQIAAYEAASENERVKLLIFLAGNDPDTAEWLLQKYPLQGKHAKNRSVFVKGLVQKSRGDLTGAAQTFRDALADDPSLTLVRAELAKTLVELQQDDSAKHHLKLLESEAPNDAEAKGIRSFIEQVDARRPYTISGYVSLAPSTNLNGGSNHKVVYVPIAGFMFPYKLAQPESGIGVAAGLDAAYTQRLGNDFMLVAAGGLDAKVYNNRKYDSYGLSQSLELRRLIENGYVGVGGVSSQSFDLEETGFTYVSFGPRVSLSYQISPRNSLNASAVYEWRENIVKSDEDSTALMLNGALTHGFDQTLQATVFGGFDAIRNEHPLFSYDAYRGGLSVYKELPKGVTLKLTGQASDTQFKAFNGSLGVTRHDKRLSGTVNLTKRDLNLFGFAPSIEYTYSQNFSNSNAYDQKNHAVDFRLTKDF
jgi:outer membrane protein